MLPAHRMTRRQFVVMSILGLLLVVINLDTLHLMYWPVNARYVIAYPRLFLNRPWYIYDAVPPGMAYGLIPECVTPPELGDSWNTISTDNGGTMLVRTATNAPVRGGYTGHLAVAGVVKQVPSMYPSICPPVIF